MRRQGAWPTAARLVLALMTSWFLFACGQNNEEIGNLNPGLGENGSCSLELPLDVTDQAAAAAVLNAEGEFVVSQDIDALMRLWAEDGRIADAKHTPDNLEDDQTWQGVDAIRHRYVRWVFPGAPAMAQPADLVIDVKGDEAAATGTTRIGDEVSPAGDRWRLVKIEGCWFIEELVFNLEPP